MRRQSGQTLIVFALMMAFVFLGLLGLVGNADVLMFQYDQASSEALVGAQAGASEVDLQLLYSSNVRTLDTAAAESTCRSSAEQDGSTTAVCTATGNTVTATVTRQVRLPIPVVPVSTTVTAKHTARAIFGGILPQ